MKHYEWHLLNKKPYLILALVSATLPLAFSFFFRLLGVDAPTALGPFPLTLSISIPAAITLFIATIYVSWMVSHGVVYDYLPDKRNFLFSLPGGRTKVFRTKLHLHSALGAGAVSIGFWVSESIYCAVSGISLLTPLLYAVVLAISVFSMAIISACVGVLFGSTRATVLNGIIWACLVPNTLANSGPVWVSLIAGSGMALLCLAVAATLATIARRRIRTIDCF
ncbi:hypothetical protein [Mobiluncus porci]|uniref:ABC-2 family transporter protein n=1 Tax=Mobiluncus porci TaxID=2652278 RepID=A0A7K0K597_9ACTO|nr:hypothetical protein [Mobiluncus porci]MST50652.1 hypothetical protein [Mobiluncus porci]